MAIQLRASSSFSSAPSTGSLRYDVFLSFRGEDTRDSFTGHLYNSLVRRGIKTFIDNDITRGEEISQALLRAIEESKLSLIVFSENYASSKWCLGELVHILKCRRLKNQMVQPIFYKVDPSDVRHQTGKFGASHADLERRFKDDMRKVLRWRAALSEAATLSGWHFSGGYEYEFIDKIVENIFDMFAQVYEPTYLDTPECQVELDSRVKHMLEILEKFLHRHLPLPSLNSPQFSSPINSQIKTMPSNPSSLYPQVIQTNPDAPKPSSMYPTVDVAHLADAVSETNQSLQSSEEILVKIPGAIVHLIEKAYSIELACGDLTIVALRQGNVVAVLARVGDEIQWPLAKDEAAVKLDHSHYFFILRVPADGSSENGEMELLNYGLTIATKGQDGLKKELDRVLETYSCLSEQKMTGLEHWDVLDASQ